MTDLLKYKHKDLVLGDVITIKAPFEENTKTYYNGYDVLDVRGELVTDSFGRTSKWRPVMVVSTTSDQLAYLPLTTSHGSKHDCYHQYQLQDNDMIERPKWKPNAKSFVEIGSLRVIDSQNHYTYQKHGQISDRDLVNIKDRLVKDFTRVTVGCDTYKYVTKDNVTLLMDKLKTQGFVTNENNPLCLTRDTTSFIFQEDGLLYCHFDMSLDAVIKRQSDFEGRELPIKQPIDKVTFTEVVDHLQDTFNPPKYPQMIT